MIFAATSASPTVAAVVVSRRFLPALSRVTVFSVATAMDNPVRPMLALRLVEMLSPASIGIRCASRACSTVVAVVQKERDAPSTLTVTGRPNCTAMEVPSTTGVSGPRRHDIVLTHLDALPLQHLADGAGHGADVAARAVHGEPDVLALDGVPEEAPATTRASGPRRHDRKDLAHDEFCSRIRHGGQTCWYTSVMKGGCRSRKDNEGRALHQTVDRSTGRTRCRPSAVGWDRVLD